MTTYKGSITALCIVAVMILLSYCITGHNDKTQADKEYIQLGDNSNVSQTESIYIDEKSSESIQQSAATTKETISTVQINLQGLEPYRQAFINAGNKYGVDYKLLISIAILESGWGTSQYAIENNNIFGWCSGEMKFKSVEACINYVAEFISREYLSPGGMYFKGNSIDDIAKHYNENPSEWAEEIKKIYESL